MRIGLIGCGNIGKFLLQTVNIGKMLPHCHIAAVYDGRNTDLSHLTQEFGVVIHHDFTSFIESDIDLVIEAANIKVVEEYATDIIKRGKDLVVVSVGALADDSFYNQLKQLCEETGAKIYIPSGAIGGLDVLKAAMSIQQLQSVSITTRKPPQAIAEQYVTEEIVLFEGPASEAIKRFPQNVNVSIILSLAGLGCEQTRVTVIADPKVTRNNHCIEATGAFGKITVNIENDPMPNNPKTSYLAALSVLSTLKNKEEIVHIG